MNDRNDRAYEESYAERYQQLLECYNRASEWQRWQVEGLPRGDGGKVFPHQEEMRRAPGAKARWDELGEEVLKRLKKEE